MRPRTAMTHRASACVAAILFAAMCLAARPASASSMEGEFLSLLNRERSSRGLSALTVTGELATLGERHSEEMAREERIWHTPDLGSKVRNWQWLGENVGMGPTVRALHDAFMRSDSHRENILFRAYEQAGIGAVLRNDVIYVTVLFVKWQAVSSPAKPSVRAPRQPVAPVPRARRVAPAPVRPPSRTVPMLQRVLALGSVPAARAIPARPVAARGSPAGRTHPSVPLMIAIGCGGILVGRARYRRALPRRATAADRLTQWSRWVESHRLPLSLQLAVAPSLPARARKADVVISLPVGTEGAIECRARDEHVSEALGDGGPRCVVLEWAGVIFCAFPDDDVVLYLDERRGWTLAAISIEQLRLRGARMLSQAEIPARALAGIAEVRAVGAREPS